jgi:hypothetical protein
MRVNLDDVEVKFYCGGKDVTPKDLKIEGNTISWDSADLTENDK